MRIVAISGPKYCGKDTAGKALLQLDRGTGVTAPPLFRRAPMAEGVKRICAEAFGYTDEMLEDPVLKETKTDIFPFVEPRWPMMDIANWFRKKYGGDIWARRWEREARYFEAQFCAPNKIQICHVMTDLRFPEELEMLKRLNALIIYIVRDEAEETLKAKQSAGDAMALNPSEAHYDLIFSQCDHAVNNNGTIPELHAQIQTLVRQRFGFWGHWGTPAESRA